MDTANLVGNSTILEPAPADLQIGNGTPSISEPAGKDDGYKPQSIEDVLDAEAKRLRTDEGKDADDTKAKDKAPSKDAKADLDAKTKADTEAKEKAARARAQDGKFAKAAAAEGDDTTDGEEGDKVETEADKTSRRERTPEEVRREAEKRTYSVVAQRFTPEARAKWDNVPHPVKAEIYRLEQEREADAQRTRPMLERYEQIRQYDDIARANGRDLKQSLEKVTAIEQALARNPIAGLNMILREIGPKKPDGQTFSLYEVAEHIVRNGPQAYQQTMAQAAQQMQQRPTQQQPNPEIAALRQEIQSMKAEQTIVPVVNRFAETHPDFEELAPNIKTILDKGVIDDIYGKGLTHEQKLDLAYRMAGGRAAIDRAEEAEVNAHSETTTARPVNPDAGRKSVRGAPSNGVDVASDDRETDLNELLRKELRKLSS